VRRITSVLFLAVCLLVASAVPAHAVAPRVRPDAQVIVHVLASECAAPDAAAWVEPSLLDRGEGWRLIGGAGDDWIASLDLSNVDEPWAKLVSRLEKLAEAVGNGDMTAAKTLVTAYLALKPRITQRLSVNGVDVVAGVHAGSPDPFQTTAAAASLARTCRVALDRVRITHVPASEVAWRVSYRSGVEDPGASVTQGAKLAAKLHESVNGAVIVGWHRPQGGVALVNMRGHIWPSLPADEAMTAAGLHGLAQKARAGAWSNPFQAVVRFYAKGERLGAALETARDITKIAGSRCQIMVGPSQTRHDGKMKKGRLRRLGVEAGQVLALLNGMSFPLATGAKLVVESRWEGELRAVSAIDTKGRKTALGKLGKLVSTTAPTPLATTADERGVVYLSVPNDRTLPVAAAVAAHAPVKGVEWTTVSWPLLRDDETLPILDWWQGKR